MQITEFKTIFCKGSSLFYALQSPFLGIFITLLYALLPYVLLLLSSGVWVRLPPISPNL